MSHSARNSQCPSGRRLRLALVLILSMQVLLACDPLPKKMLDSAEARWKQGDYLGAVQAYEQLTIEYPKSPFVNEAYMGIGTIEYLYLKNNPKAVEAFRKVVTDDPGGALALKAQRTLAEIYQNKYGDYRRAIVEYQNLLDNTRNRSVGEEVQYLIGDVYFEQGEFDQARNEWDQLIKQSPKSEWADNAMFRTGSSLYLQNRYSEALTTYLETANKYPDSDVLLELRFWTAGCLEEMERTEEALAIYREIEKSYPTPKVIAFKIKRIEEREKSGHITKTTKPAEEMHDSE